MSNQIQLTETAFNDMLKSLENVYPFEGCGFLFGTDEDTREISFVLPVENKKTENKRRRFEISPLDYMKAERHALENNMNLLGIFHSHPDHPAKPSEHDLKQAVPFFSYIIVSVENGKSVHATSWRLNDSGAFEYEIVKNKLN